MRSIIERKRKQIARTNALIKWVRKAYPKSRGRPSLITEAMLARPLSHIQVLNKCIRNLWGFLKIEKHKAKTAHGNAKAEELFPGVPYFRFRVRRPSAPGLTQPPG